jgi:hypothetical protein
VRSTRVLLAYVPPLLSELLTRVIQGESMEVVDEVHGPVELLLAVRRWDAEVVFLAQTDLAETKDICTNLLDEYPYLRIFVLPLTGGNVTAYSRRINAVAIPAKPLDHLLRAVREGRQE